MIDTKYRTLEHQTAIVEYDAPCAFDLDEVFYRVERTESKYSLGRFAKHTLC